MVCGIIEAYLSKCVLKILESTECLIMKEIHQIYLQSTIFYNFFKLKNNSMTKTVTESGEYV